MKNLYVYIFFSLFCIESVQAWTYKTSDQQASNVNQVYLQVTYRLTDFAENTIIIDKINYDHKLMEEVKSIDIVYRQEEKPLTHDPFKPETGPKPFNIAYIIGTDATKNPRMRWLFDPTNKRLFVATGGTDEHPIIKEIYIPGKIEETMSAVSGPFGIRQLEEMAADAWYRKMRSKPVPCLVFWTYEFNPKKQLDLLTTLGYGAVTGVKIPLPISLALEDDD